MFSLALCSKHNNKSLGEIAYKENKQLILDATTARDKAMHNIEKAEVLHHQSRET